MRKLISIRIDPKIYQTAREMGLNISKTCEKSLKQEIQRLTNSDCPTNFNCPTSRMSTLIKPTQPSRFTDTRGEPGSPRANSTYSGESGREQTSRNKVWLRPGVHA